MRTIPPSNKSFHPLGLGGSIFETDLWSAERDQQLVNAMQTALDAGINHFDTAAGYGNGASERLMGRFFAQGEGRREKVFLATKVDIPTGDPSTHAAAMVENVKRSLERLQTGCIDLYYIHWPRSGVDMRPTMEGLERARQMGLIESIGVSNFSVEQMEQVSEVGQINAQQIPYNLFWRFPERDMIPYCIEKGIAVVTYASIAMGILTGKFNRELNFPPGDHRNTILFFQEPTWGAIYDAVQEMQALAREVGRPLHQLAIRWGTSQPGITCSLVGARSPEQAAENAKALEGDLPPTVLDRLTNISDRAMKKIPAISNPYNYNP